MRKPPKAVNVQVAETALPTLGAMLKWEVKTAVSEAPPDFVYELAWFCTDQGRRYYNIGFNSDGSPQTNAQACYFKPDGRHGKQRQNHQPESNNYRGGHWYNSVVDVKAACEIHVRTDVFPAPVKPEVFNTTYYVTGDREI